MITDDTAGAARGGASAFYDQFAAETSEAVDRLRVEVARAQLLSTRAEPVCGHDPRRVGCKACEVAAFVESELREMAKDDAACRSFADATDAEIVRGISRGVTG